ncbi:MAG: ABC transporter substrate-binding protein [Acidobacteria bacterium]|nr:ABC transporter substrate-binding protein [Acidobacteriota bacterium]
MDQKLTTLGLTITLAITVACSTSPSPEPGAGTSRLTAPSGPVSMDKNDYPVFPNADAGADPSVPAEQGDKGFTGEGWETNTDFDLIGDPRAYKGGVFRDFSMDFPATLRAEGPEANAQTAREVNSMVFESLLGIHPTTEKYIPSLATHWQVSSDKMTYRFRINPHARFSDGTPVTSEDVVATYDFLMDPTLQEPINQMTFGKLERPVAESKYIVSVKAKELNWRNFLYFSGMYIMPAHILKTMNGAKYITDYNYNMLPGTGPFIVSEADVVKGQSVTMRRRKDYWAEKARANVGANNFDAWRIVVVRDLNLAFEMFKKGELDTYSAFSFNTRQWVEELNFDEVQRGLIQKRRVFNHAPKGFSGFAYNARLAPFNDIRVRKAFTLLLNRRQIIEKLMYNQFEPLNSFFPGSPYENPNNPKNEYDPQQALRLLEEAGWNSRDNQGRLVKNGVPLQGELTYHSQTLEPQLTVYQEDLRKVGISLNLRLVTFETKVQLMQDRKFQMVEVIYGALLFPNPETSWHSSLADQPNNNNITGFKNARVDEICAAYDKMFDIDERVRAIREIDGIVVNSYHYTLFWTAPYVRIAYWNKFGTPVGYFPRIGAADSAPSLWWIDPEKEERLLQARRDTSIRLEVGETDDKYWLEQGVTQLRPAGSDE